MRKWLRDEWFWGYYNIKITDSDGCKVYSDSLSGIDSTSMKEFEEEAFSDAQEWLDSEMAAALDYACRT